MTDERSGHVLHLCTAAEWAEAQRVGERRAPSLDTEGFVHCSLPRQIAKVAAERFAGRTDLVLLVVDPARLDVPMVFEDSYDLGDEFPHVYGPIPVAAVVDTIPHPKF